MPPDTVMPAAPPLMGFARRSTFAPPAFVILNTILGDNEIPPAALWPAQFFPVELPWHFLKLLAILNDQPGQQHLQRVIADRQCRFIGHAAHIEVGLQARVERAIVD